MLKKLRHFNTVITVFIALFPSFVFIIVVFADTLVFKSGKTREGAVINEEETIVTFSIDDMPIKFHRDEIKEIIKGPRVDSSQPKVSQGLNDTIVIPSANSPQPQASQSASDTIAIPIHSMVEFDFRTKAEIYAGRTYEVMKYPQLLEKNYAPSDAVFGQIVDKKPWWGILGRCYYGDGEQSIAGPSEQSRYVMNPFLLVALDNGAALRINETQLTAREIYPRPSDLRWDRAKKIASVTYDVSAYRSLAERYDYPKEIQRIFDLIAYNARDLGYDYLFVDVTKSKGIVSLNKTNAPLAIPFFIHCGGSCGYSGGCNNMSPTAPNFRIEVTALPAKVFIGLWHKQPANNNSNADVTFIINLV